MSDILKEKFNDLKLNSKNIYFKAIITTKNKDTLLDTIAASLSNGVEIIELSGRQVPAQELYDCGIKAKLLAAQFDATFIIDERLDIAYLLESDGIFLKNSDLNMEKARELLGHNILIGTDDNKNTDVDYYLLDSAIECNKPAFINLDSGIKKPNQPIGQKIWISNLITNSQIPQETVKLLKTFIESQSS